MDWRLLTGAGDMEWADWVATQPVGAVSMRGDVVLDDDYSGAFTDSRAWLCLKITDAARSTAVWACVPRLSDDGSTISVN